MTSKLRRRLLEEAAFHCELCKGSDPSGKHLHVHHRDRNRRNDADDNLQVLCVGCHWEIHRGYSWSDELGAFDTPWTRERVALNGRWATGPKETVTINLDATVLAELRTMAFERFGSDDIGRLITEMRIRHSGGLSKFPATEEVSAA